MKDIRTLLKETTTTNLDVENLINKHNLSSIIKVLDEIIQSPKDYQELKDNSKYNANFLKVVSLIYLIEQNKNQNTNSNNFSLSTNVFSPSFIKKLDSLIDEHSSNPLLT